MPTSGHGSTSSVGNSAMPRLSGHARCCRYPAWTPIHPAPSPSGSPTRGCRCAAIARATHIPSTRLYETLTLARMEGRLLDLPRDDWPPGCPRDQRSLRLSRMVTQNPEAIALAMQRVFSLTSAEVILLTALIQNVNVSRERIDMPRKTVDVHICHLRRRLAPFGITIATLWGYGYQLSVDGRAKAMELILSTGCRRRRGGAAKAQNARTDLVGRVLNHKLHDDFGGYRFLRYLRDKRAGVGLGQRPGGRGRRGHLARGKCGHRPATGAYQSSSPGPRSIPIRIRQAVRSVRVRHERCPIRWPVRSGPPSVRLVRPIRVGSAGAAAQEGRLACWRRRTG